MTLYQALVAPFVEYGFMRRALVACCCLAAGGGPVGVLLILRRMSLMGDALGHAVLPGAAIGFLIAGLSVPAMSLGGAFAGLVVALAAGFVARTTRLKEDASFAGFYLISLALGVLIVSTKGSNLDLLRVLFGTVIAIDTAGLLLIASVATLTLLALALLYRPLVIECFDPGFLRASGGGGGTAHALFLALVVLNLVAGFQALGTLMAVGLLMLPAAASRFWARHLWSMALTAATIAAGSGYVGLLVSFHADLPSGPAIVLAAGAAYLGSLALGPNDGLLRRAPSLAERDVVPM